MGVYGYNNPMTEVLRYDLEPSLLLERCAAALAAGELVILPTDTVYGLAARADMPEAVKAVFAVKGRDAAKALVVMVSSLEEAMGITAAEHREPLRRLGTLWPGPLTLVVKTGGAAWSASVAPGSKTLGMRVPDDLFLLRLMEITGPLVVTSANPAGKRAPDSFGEIDERLLGAAALAVDGGRRGSGKPSTVAEIRGGGVEVLRLGEMEEDELIQALERNGESERPLTSGSR
jgi:L-threonylcarbamoyladenylate synthase